MPSPIPPLTRTDWTPGTRTGVPGGIAQFLPGGANERINLIDVTDAPYNADPTGVADATAAIQAALDAAVADDVVYIPTGTYKLLSALNVAHSRDNITIRGDGQGLTILDCHQNGIVYGTQEGWISPFPFTPVTAGLTKDSTEITVDSATSIADGAIIVIEYENQTDNTAIAGGSIPVFGYTGPPDLFWLRKQITRVTAKAGEDLTIFPPLYRAADAGLGAQCSSAILQLEFFGIESLTIDMTNSNSSAAIQMAHAYGCWVYDVEIHNMKNYGVDMEAGCLQSEIRLCYIHTRAAGGSNGAGWLCNNCSGILVVDNIFYDLAPSIEVNSGSSGNAFVYNYVENPPNEFDVINIAIDVNHGPWNGFNLYEGNISPSILADCYFGGCSEDTIFRNWFHGTYQGQDSFTFELSLKRFTLKYNICGNVLGKQDVYFGQFSFGEPNIGNSDFDGESEFFDSSFPIDWKMTATLTDRYTDTTGEFTLISGSMRETQAGLASAYNGSTGYTLSVITITSGGTVVNGALTVYAGGVFDFSIPSGVLPAASTVMDLYPHTYGYQELNLDVENSAVEKGNYLYGVGGTPGSMTPLDGDTLDDSLLYASEPDFWDVGLPWPPFDPTTPNDASFISIPAGARFLAGGAPTAPNFTTNVSILGAEFEGATLTAAGGIATGNPIPTYTFQWKRDGVDIGGATASSYLLTGADVGTIISVVKTATNSQGSDTTEAFTEEIQPFLGDVLVVTQVANASPVTELWLRGALTSGVSAPLAYYLVQHSGPYPTQPDNNYVYARFGTPQDNVYVFQGTISEAEAIASVP